MSFQELFTESKGQPINYKGKEIKLADKVILISNEIALKITLISTNSKWRQGIVLETKGGFHVNKQKISNKIVLWEDTAPKQVEIKIKSKDKVLFIYNVWNTGDETTHYWHYGAALYTEQISNIIMFYCNDGQPNDDFTDLVFKVEYGDLSI